jgi:hypothetical protein
MSNQLVPHAVDIRLRRNPIDLYPVPDTEIGAVQYWLMANLVVVIHFGFVCFVVAGGLLLLKWPWVALFHIPAALWGALIEFQGGICPLTPLENQYWQLAGQAGYAGGFIENYLLPVLYPAFLQRDIQIVLGTLVLGINIAIYSWVIQHAFSNSD